MVRIRNLALGAFLLALPACFDAEISLKFDEGGSVETYARMQMTRQLHDMTGGNEDCEGEAELTEEHYSCAIRTTMPIDELLESASIRGFDGEVGEGDGFVVERLDENLIRVTIDPAALFANDEKQPPTTEEMGGMEDMVRAAMAGHSIVLSVAGPEILTTTGVISEDQDEAQRVIPLVTLLDDDPDFGGPFVTEIRLAEKSCMLWVFCG